MEVSVVGDFTEEEVESCLLDYLGTVRAANSSNKPEHIEKISFMPVPSDLHSQQVYTKDTDERACAYIAGPAPNRWGFATEGKDLFNVIQSSGANAEISEPANSDLMEKTHINVRNHRLFFGIALSFLAEIFNSRRNLGTLAWPATDVLAPPLGLAKLWMSFWLRDNDRLPGTAADGELGDEFSGNCSSRGRSWTSWID